MVLDPVSLYMVGCLVLAAAFYAVGCVVILRDKVNKI